MRQANGISMTRLGDIGWFTWAPINRLKLVVWSNLIIEKETGIKLLTLLLYLVRHLCHLRQ